MLAGVAVSCLLAAWMLSNAPWSAPDEASHYLRAMEIAHGELLGPRVNYPREPWLSQTQLNFSDQDTRAVSVPAAQSPADEFCLDGKPDRHGSCVEADPTGDYYPVAYLLPAVVVTAAPHANYTGMWLTRLVSMLPCLCFLLLAVALLASESAWSLLGLLAAITPMVLFVTSVLNPSGLETAASLALAAAALRIARDRERAPRWAWTALVASGAVTICSWQAGPGFALADLAPAAILLGRRDLAALWRSCRRELAGAGVLLGAALLAYIAYSEYSGVSHSGFQLTGIHSILRDGLPQLGYVLHDWIGNFGGLTIHLPSGSHWVWWLLMLALVIGAMLLGDLRMRLLVAAVTLVALVFPMVAYDWVYRLSGFGMQGRQVLPILVLIPLVAGEVIHLRLADRLHAAPTRYALGAALAVIALFQLFAWWINARSSAGQPDALWFLSGASWSPPLGWWPWMALVVIGSGSLLALAGSTALRRTRPAALAPAAT